MKCFAAFVPGHYISNCRTKCLYPTTKVRALNGKETTKWKDHNFLEAFIPDKECVEYHIFQVLAVGLPGMYLIL
jgi:hypothetical protein